jgi:hypothetical protein
LAQRKGEGLSGHGLGSVRLGEANLRWMGVAWGWVWFTGDGCGSLGIGEAQWLNGDGCGSLEKVAAQWGLCCGPVLKGDSLRMGETLMR